MSVGGEMINSKGKVKFVVIFTTVDNDEIEAFARSIESESFVMVGSLVVEKKTDKFVSRGR